MGRLNGAMKGWGRISGPGGHTVMGIDQNIAERVHVPEQRAKFLPMAKLSFEQARELLGFHCGTDPRVDDPRWQNGMLSTLRPYKGLRRDAMTSVDECVDAVAAHLLESELLDRRVVNSLWGICHFVRAWALHPDGMLQSNGLTDNADAAELDAWVFDLSYRVSMLLDGCEKEASER